jgi:geranylgeranyl reductase family protein
MKNKVHDVIVVGAGPIGSYTAYLLAKEGMNVGIFERNPFIGKDINCTGIISVQCLKKFDLPAEVVLKQVDSIKAIAPSGNYLRYQSESPLAYIVNRSLFDQEINKMAVQHGATTYLNAKVSEVKITDNAFTIKIRTEDRERVFSSKVGVIATGFELHSLNGISGNSTSFLFGIQTDVKMEDVDGIEVYFGEKIAPGSFAWVVPTNGNSVKIGLIVNKTPADFLKGFLKNPYIALRLKSPANHVKCSPIPVRRIPKSYAERLIVVGEAAGQVKATTGGGIYFGILCAEIAANTILKAVKYGDYREKTFQEYETAWRKKIEPELRAGVMLRSIFSRLSDHQIDFLMELAKRDGVLPLIRKADFDWHKDLISYLIRDLIRKNLFRKT